MWPKNILYLLLNDLYLILWGIPIKNNSHFKTCIKCLFLIESAPFIAKFLIAIEVRFVKRGSPPAIRWTVSRTCSDLSCRMITSPSNWSISPRSLDWTTKVYCSLTSKNINLYCYQSFHFFLNSLIFFFTFKHKTKWGLECINVFNRLSSLVWKSEERVPLVPFLLQT